MQKHIKDHNHKLCICGGYHFAHRPGSPLCIENPMSGLLLAERAGATEEELLDIEVDIAFNCPGKRMTEWRD
jgi:hypothetical protein